MSLVLDENRLILDHAEPSGFHPRAVHELDLEDDLAARHCLDTKAFDGREVAANVGDDAGKGVVVAVADGEVDAGQAMTAVVEEADRVRFGDQTAWFTQRIRVETHEPRLAELAQDLPIGWMFAILRLRYGADAEPAPGPRNNRMVVV